MGEYVIKIDTEEEHREEIFRGYWRDAQEKGREIATGDPDIKEVKVECSGGGTLYRYWK